MLEISKHLTVVIKPTRNCNLRCKYCSVGEPTPRTMTQEEVAASIEKIVTRIPGCFTKFIWHGGEPLLPGIDFYRHVVEVEKPLIQAGFGIVNVVQSNGTLINEEWAEFLAQEGFGVGLSVDGPPGINDLTRVFPEGEGTSEAIKRGSSLLDARSVEHGFLVVISKHNSDRINEIINFMHEQGKSYKLVAVSPIGRACEARESIMNAGDSYSDSQIRLLERWLQEGNSNDRSALWKYIVPVLTGEPIECIFHRDCQQSFIGVDCNADVYPCGRFCGDERFKYGNFLKDSFETVWNHPLRVEMTQRWENLKSCHPCSFANMCNGGCPMQGFLNGGLAEPDYNCRQYRRIFGTIERTIMELSGI